jgi:hypothetical protein
MGIGLASWLANPNPNRRIPCYVRRRGGLFYPLLFFGVLLPGRQDCTSAFLSAPSRLVRPAGYVQHRNLCLRGGIISSTMEGTGKKEPWERQISGRLFKYGDGGAHVAFWSGPTDCRYVYGMLMACIFPWGVRLHACIRT